MNITKTCLFKFIENFTAKNWTFSDKICDIFFYISAQNIDCGFSLEPPRRGGSNEYQQSMFLSRNKKIMYTPVNPTFTIQQWSLRESRLYRHVFVMIRWQLVSVSNIGSGQIQTIMALKGTTIESNEHTHIDKNSISVEVLCQSKLILVALPKKENIKEQNIWVFDPFWLFKWRNCRLHLLKAELIFPRYQNMLNNSKKNKSNSRS